MSWSRFEFSGDHRITSDTPKRRGRAAARPEVAAIAAGQGATIVSARQHSIVFGKGHKFEA
jgi:hypothetical protein